MKKFIALLLASVLFLGSFTATALGQDSVLASNHWARQYLENLYNYGIMRGDLNGNLNPDRYITRAECISMLNRALGYNSYQKGKLPFKDITGDEWYADDIAIAYEMGYFSGTSKNKADADSNLTREQAVSLICRNLKLEEPVGEILNFTDSRTFSSWSKGAIGAGAEKGFISGYPDGSFRPFNNVTRGEFAKMLSDVIGTLISDSGSYSYGTVPGNATISSSGGTLSNTTINGDLYITAGVGTGFVNLENVRVIGDVIISGGGQSNAGDNSINFNNCYVNRLIVDGEADKVISVDAKGSTQIQKTIVKTDAFFEDFGDRDRGFINIELAGEPETTLTLSGDYKNVSVMKPENYLVLGKGSIYNLTVDEDAQDSIITLDKNAYVLNASLDAPCQIVGDGDMGSVTITSSGVEIEMLPDEIIIRPGITAIINGEEMTSQEAEESSARPRILAGYPQEDEMGPNKASFIYQTNKPGKVYWAVTLEEDEDEIDEDDIIKPNNVKKIISSGTFTVKNAEEDVTSSVSKLTADTDYVISAVLEDERGNISSIKTEAFTSEDNTVPSFISGYPKVTSQSSTTLDITVNMSKRSTVYWAVFPKGSQAPTADELKDGKLSGDIDSGEEKRCQKNVEKTFTASGLKEQTSYDVYLIASDGTNDSKVTKITASTKDTTPPSFITSYPKQDKMTDKTVDVKVKVNEDCTVYYVVCKKGTVFPAPIPPSTTSPDLSSQEGIDAIITGNNTEINGKANVKANTEATVKISKLEPESTYDLYMVAQDKSGNNSSGVKITIKTTDMVAPTATQEFSQDVNGEPKVESDIKIVFSEEVLDRNTMKSLAKETLKDNIILYHIEDNEETIVNVDYSKVTIGIDDEGKTYVLFPAASLNLNSGEKYQFELNYIVDTSNNRMKDQTRLDEFKTLSPQVQLVKTEAPQEMDITFAVEPQAIKTSDSVLFDMIFETDTTVEFELYEKNAEGKFVKYDYNPLISKDTAMTLHYIIDRKSEGGEDYHFEPFNKLTSREFGIRFIGLEGSNDRESWNKTVKMNIKCVIGSKTILSSLAGNPKDNFDTAIKDGATQVNSPLKFEVSASFTDTVIPSFIEGYPKLEAQGEVASEFGQIGDTLIRPLIMTNKKCDFYYLVAPKGTVKEPVNAIQIMNGAINPNGGVSGKYAVASGNVEFPVLIEGLVPETEYDMFYFLKGTPPEPSQVYKKTFKTLKVAPPNISVQVIDRGENSVIVKITSDKNATIDWMLLPSLQCDSWFEKDSAGNSTLIMSETSVAEIIRNGRENLVYKPVDFGTVITKYDKTEMKYTAEVSVTGLERNIYYTFFAVAKSTLSSGETNVGGDSKIAFQRDITPADVTPPAIDSVITTIRNGSDSNAGKSYRGTVMITFTEAIYYIPGENEQMQPLTAQFFADNIKTSTANEDDVTVTLDTYTTKRDDETGEKALKSITLTFKNILHNDTIFFPFELCDKNGNKAGMLRLTFVDMESGGTGRKDSYWDYKFVTEVNE